MSKAAVQACKKAKAEKEGSAAAALKAEEGRMAVEAAEGKAAAVKKAAEDEEVRRVVMKEACVADTPVNEKPCIWLT